MNVLLSIILYIVIIFSILQNWLLIAAVAVLIFISKYNSFTLVPLAILIDGYFGNFYNLPLLSIAAILLSGAVELIRPRFIHSQTI